MSDNHILTQMDVFLRFLLLHKLIETQQKQYDTDGYKHLYVAKNLEVEKIQSQFESNSLVLKQRQMIENTNYTKEIYNTYLPIKKEFHGLLTHFVNVDNINNSYDKQTEFVELHDITENGTDFMKQDLKLYCSIPQEIDLQLSSKDICYQYHMIGGLYAREILFVFTKMDKN